MVELERPPLSRVDRALLAAVLAGLCLQAQTPTPTARYYVVFLRPDPARKPLEKAEGARIQAAHMANIHKMADDGVLIAAGPFDDKPATISGIFVFHCESLQVAQAIAARDPTVVEHRNTVDVHAWDGPLGIGVEYFRLHKADPATPENMQVHPLGMLYRGTAWDEKGSTREGLLAEHERYVGQLREKGKLGAAGAVKGPDELLGLVMFNPIAFEDAQGLLNKDPAVQAGVLRVEYHHWWSSDHVLPWTD